MTKFIGIFGDLIGLQNLERRGQSLGRLRMLMDKINTTFKDTIIADFMIIKDTEFKAAVKRKFPLQDFLALYNQEFGKEVGTHLGLGLGGHPKEKDTGGCFHSARKAMFEARDKGTFLIFHGFEMNRALNALFYFIHEMNETMTERQRKVVEIYRKSGDIVSVASELYLPKQAVFDSIKAAKYEIYNEAWCGLQELLRFSVLGYDRPSDRDNRGRSQDRRPSDRDNRGRSRDRRPSDRDNRGRSRDRRPSDRNNRGRSQDHYRPPGRKQPNRSNRPGQPTKNSASN